MDDTAAGTVIRQRREELGLSQTVAAHRVGISRQLWNEIELGKRRSSNETLAKVERLLRLPTGLVVALAPAPRQSMAQLRAEVMGMVETMKRDELLHHRRLATHALACRLTTKIRKR